MEEVKRFLKSIEMDYTEEFTDVEIAKVIYNKETKIYSVILKCPHVLDFDFITNLFNHAHKGINGKDKCYIILEYNTINDEDIKNYMLTILRNIVFEHPSLSGIEDSFQNIENNMIYLTVSSKAMENSLKEKVTYITKTLQDYGLGNFKVNISIDENKNASLKEEIAKSKEIVIEKKEDSPIILGFHKDGEVTEIRNIAGEMKGIIVEGYVFGIEAS